MSIRRGDQEQETEAQQTGGPETRPQLHGGKSAGSPGRADAEPESDGSGSAPFPKRGSTQPLQVSDSLFPLNSEGSDVKRMWVVPPGSGL